MKSLTTCMLWMLFTGWACTGKAPQEKESAETIEIDSAKDYYQNPDEKIIFDYGQFQGTYDHESNTGGFSAMLTLAENGNDLLFTLSVAQGNCKGEAKGIILMVSHEENYYVGFYEHEDCPLQFTLMLQENKIDVKEINLCRLHESSCSFEGSYAKKRASL